jgi:ribosomal-protein-alanine N-acetyltransferase
MMTIAPVMADEAATLAAVHGSSFPAPWSAADIASLLDGPGGSGLIARDEAGAARGFILVRSVADEAEIITLAVLPAFRRHGLALALVDAAAILTKSRGASSLFLEVNVGNVAAIGLYRRAGFADIGRRRGYYANSGGSASDALVMRLDLNSAPT